MRARLLILLTLAATSILMPPPAVSLGELDRAQLSAAQVPDDDSLALANMMATAENVELVGHIGGTTYAVFVQGNYAYTGVGPRLTILDVSTPTSPVVLGKTGPLPGNVTDIYVSGDYAYVLNSGEFQELSLQATMHGAQSWLSCLGENRQGKHLLRSHVWGLPESHCMANDYQGGLQVLDVSNPANPIEISVYDTPGSAVGLYISGGLAYIADGSAGLRVVDVSDPANPIELSVYDTLRANDVCVIESLAYVADGSAGLRVVDVSDPVNLIELGAYDTPEWVYGVYISGNLAYLANGYDGLRVLDVSDPVNPVEISFYDTPGFAGNVYAQEGLAYIADGSAGLRIVDVSNPANPNELGVYDTPGSAVGFYISGDLTYIADRSAGLRVVDASDPANLIELGAYDPLWAYDVYVSGGLAYVLGGSLRVIDVNDPQSPIELGACDTAGGALDVYISEDLAYIANREFGLQIVNVNNPTNPTELGIYDTPRDAIGVHVSGDVAYVADLESLQVVDVSDPTNPSKLGVYNTSGTVENVYVSEELAYVVGGGGLRIVDLSDPTNPSELGVYHMGLVTSVHAEEDLAYVVENSGFIGSYNWLRVMDVSDPAHPIELGAYNTPGWFLDVRVNGNIAYVVDGGVGLRVMDVSDPTNPTEIGFYDTPGLAHRVHTGEGLAYVADASGGLFILRYLQPVDISGRVLDDSGNPLTNVQVTAGGSYSATTNASGVYTISDVLPGDYTLIPNKTGCLFTPSERMVHLPPNAINQDFVGQCEFQITGRVSGASDQPYPGVQISAGAGRLVTSGADGGYAFTSLVSGTYILTPTLADYVFQPSTRTVSVPPDAAGQSFIILPGPVSTTVPVGTGTLLAPLIYTDTQGLTTTLYFPTGAVTETTRLVLTPTLARGGGGWAFAGHAFEIRAYREGHLLPGLTLNKPATVTIHYSAQDAQALSDEGQLALWQWASDGWQDAANTCDPPSSYQRDPVMRRISLPICHLSLFGLFGPTYQTYLPLILHD